jgi:hypothetical protein
VRFFGVNLAFGASFPEPQDAARVAKRLRRLGFNLVRPCVKGAVNKATLRVESSKPFQGSYKWMELS